MNSALARSEDGNHIDFHNWVFTPNHSRLLLHDLHGLGYIELREAHFRNTVGHEFYVNLTVDGAGSGLSRTQLLTLADAERTPPEDVIFEA